MLVNWEDDGIPGVQPRSRLGHRASRIHLRGDERRSRAFDQAGAEVVYAAVAVSDVKRELKNHSVVDVV